MLSEERNSAEKQAENSRKTSLASTTIQSQKHSEAEKAQANDHSSENQAEKAAAEESDGIDASKRRPMSPTTLALMCDEQDSMFTAAPSPNRSEVQNNVSSSQSQPEQRTTEAYEEQERIILTKFRDCLNRLITLGEIKGKFSSSSSLSKVWSILERRTN